MLVQLTAREEKAAKRRAARRRELIASAISIPGVRTFVEGDAVVLEGAGLVRRLLLDPALRWHVREVRDGE